MMTTRPADSVKCTSPPQLWGEVLVWPFREQAEHTSLDCVLVRDGDCCVSSHELRELDLEGA